MLSLQTLAGMIVISADKSFDFVNQWSEKRRSMLGINKNPNIDCFDFACFLNEPTAVVLGLWKRQSGDPAELLRVAAGSGRKDLFFYAKSLGVKNTNDAAAAAVKNWRPEFIRLCFQMGGRWSMYDIRAACNRNKIYLDPDVVASAENMVYWDNIGYNGVEMSLDGKLVIEY